MASETGDESPDVPVRVTSAYGARTRLPFVQVVIGDQLFAWRAEEARRIGLLLIDVAAAAEGDAFVFEFARARVGADDRGAAGLMAEFREWRKKREKRS